MDCFGLITPKNPRQTPLLSCEPAYPWVAYRCFLTQGKPPRRPLAESGTAPLTRCQSSMEQQSSRRNWSTFRVASTDRSRSISGDEVSVAKWTFSSAASVSYLASALSAIAWFPRVGVRNRHCDDTRLAWKFAIAQARSGDNSATIPRI
jgi:hypothetical protein